MNWWEAILWGFVATLVLSTILSGSRSLGWTRMDMPLLLGTLFTADRDRAIWLGFVLHLINGWIFALLYIAIFIASGTASWWFGMLIGLVHALFVLIVGMALLPSLHPRMATEKQGPDPTRQLQPPGFMALNYGHQTPVATIVAHLIFGGILGFGV